MQRENCEDFDVLIIADNLSLEILPTSYNKSWVFVNSTKVILKLFDLGTSKNWVFYFIRFLPRMGFLV